jgi:hypothetical protein
MTATRALIDRMKRRAGDMAKPFIDAAEQPDATELERAFGDAARLILRDAETRAQLLPREEFERRVEAFTDWHKRHGAEMARLCRRGPDSEPQGRISEARRRATVEFDHREAEFHEWVESHALAAWIRATEDLLTLDRPSAFISSQASPVRH